MWKAIKYEKDENGWGVQVENPADGRRYWVDVSVNKKYCDIDCDWNQYIFDLKDKEDLIRKATQENNDNFDDATGVAICFLESEHQIAQDNQGNWYTC